MRCVEQLGARCVFIDPALVLEARHRVTRRYRRRVEKVIVFDVDEKLRRGGLRVIGAGHGQSAHGIFVSAFGQCFATFVRHGRTCGLLVVARVKAAALHHEVADHPVKHRAVVVLVIDVLQKVGNCLGRFVWINLHHKLTFAGDKLHARGSPALR